METGAAFGPSQLPPGKLAKFSARLSPLSNDSITPRARREDRCRLARPPATTALCRHVTLTTTLPEAGVVEEGFKPTGRLFDSLTAADINWCRTRGRGIKEPTS